MPLFCKIYDFETKIFKNLAISQSMKSDVIQTSFLKHMTIQVIAKKDKNTFFSGPGPAVSEMLLVSGRMPRISASTKNNYTFSFPLNGHKKFYVSDIVFFMMLPNIKKSNGLKKFVKHGLTISCTLFDITQICDFRNNCPDNAFLRGYSLSFSINDSNQNIKKFILIQNLINFNS